ncbi:urea transport system permease protein [Zymomonas mobilis]|uniref:Urea transport system permease protein n=1 Tax=Zymomonas mobilis TaxID=542 RepID=A0A542W2S3_ZYMMB|nr:urea ABC transporter permease subunit UrtB [Zymomonas mobilis]TQL17789.1 urea transport system permease protein [Zymomonas mobilis]
MNQSAKSLFLAMFLVFSLAYGATGYAKIQKAIAENAITTSSPDSSGDPLSGLASGQFNQIAETVSALALSDPDRAKSIVSALQTNALYQDSRHGLYLEKENGYADIRSGQKISLTDDGLKPVRINNKVRLALVTSTALFGLSSPNAATRLQSADTLYSHAIPAFTPKISAALAQEKDQKVKLAFEKAQAAAFLSETPLATGDNARLKAIAILKKSGGLDAHNILCRIAASSLESQSVKQSAKKAVSSIEFRLGFWDLLQNAFYGLSYGSVLLLAATGLAITFGIMGVINMAHGELIMIGAYVTYLVQQSIHTVFPALDPFALVVAVPVAFLACGALGVLIERGLIRFLYGRPLETLLATWGLSLILQQAIRSLFGATNIEITTPYWLAGSFMLGGIEITLNRLVIFLFAFAVLGALMMTLRRTSIGLEMRAVTQNRRMSALMGVRTPRVDALAFGLGSGIAGLAGVAATQIDNISPNLGQNYIIDSFMAVVFGGVGNLWGTFAGAMTLGMGDKVLEPSIGAVSAKIAILVLVIVYIQRHPRGMFPLRGRGVES